MSNYIETLAHVATVFAAVATILAPGAAAAAGVVPRVGPARALVLGARSRFHSAGTRPSQRSPEVKYLRDLTANAAVDQYCVVVGPKGVGELARGLRVRLRVMRSPLLTYILH